MNFKKTAVSVAVTAALSIGLVGCGGTDRTDRNSNSNSTNTVDKVNSPKGMVTGLVHDTNGNPLEGVVVYIAGMEATTNAGGMYVFNDVPVIKVDNGNGIAAGHNPLLVTVMASNDYMGATIAVSPSAQATTTTTTLFVDGFVAQAGTAALPKLNASVTGRLELADSEASVANQEITLDFVGSSSSTSQGLNNTVAIATGNYTTTTDADGNFTFTNLPADSQMRYVVSGYTGAGTVTTNDETATLNVGDVQVTAVTSGDTAPPFVVSTVGEINPTAGRVMLEDDVRDTIVINFSEPMDIEVDTDMTSSVIVKVDGQDVASTVTASDSTLTVVLPTGLTDGQELDINLLVTDFKDLAGNFIGILTPASNNTAISYDYSGGAGQVVRLEYQAFNDLNSNAPAVTSVAQQTVDAHGGDDFSASQTANASFNDVIDGDGQISQMNSSDTATATRLSALLVSTSGIIGATVITDVPRIEFTPTGASSYLISSVSGTASNVTVQSGGASSANSGGDVVITPNDVSSTTPIEFTLATTTHAVGDVITITPRDELGYSGTAITYTIVDNVAPTTALHGPYGLSPATNGSSTVVKFGDAGELADTSGQVTVGTPYLPISAGLLDNLSSTGAVVNGSTIVSDANLVEELENTRFAGGYDTISWAALNKTRIMGVGFTENVLLAGTTPATTNVSTGLTAWEENNDVTTNSAGGTVDADLIDVSVADVIAFANDDHIGVIDFAGITDTAGNAATATAAKVVVQDRMPPFVTKASFDGSELEIAFNEPVNLANGDSFTIASKTATLNAFNATDFVLSSGDTVLTIANTAFNTALAQVDFGGTAYAEPAYGSGSYTHAVLTWEISDKVYSTNRLASQIAEGNITIPSFAAVDLIGPFTYATNNSGFDAGPIGDTHTVVWTFTHPVDTVNGAGSDINGTAAAIDALFNLGGVTVATLTLSADGKTLTLTFDGAVAYTAGDTITSGSPFESNITTDTAVVNGTTQP